MSINRLDNEIGMFIKAQENWQQDPEATGRLEVTCDYPLKDSLDPSKLRGILERFAELEFEPGYLDYLVTVDGIDAGFTDYLKAAIPTAPVVKVKDDMVMVSVNGRLADLPLWEVPISNLIHDLFFKGSVVREKIIDKELVLEGVRRFQVKCDQLRGSRLSFVEAGTRWRYDYDWYDLLTTVMLGDVPYLVAGTTNPFMGIAFGMQVINNDRPEVVKLVNPSVDDVDEKVHTQEQPVVVAGCNAHQMAHLYAHFGNVLSFEWGSDLTCDVGATGRPLPLHFTYRT